MSAVVTQVDKLSFYTHLVQKTHKHYETRSTSSSQLDHNPKPSFQSPSLPSSTRAANGASAKAPPPVEGAGRYKSLESVPATAGALCGDPKKSESLPPEFPTLNVKKVLDFVTELTPDKGYKEFHGVRPAEFSLIQHAVGEAGRFWTKPKLAYDYDKHLLVVDMPSILHEASFDYLKECLTLSIAHLPYDRELVRPTISMNYLLKISNRIVNPDMTITITAVDGAPSEVLVPGLGECALSENRVHIFNKIEREIFAHPEALLAIIVLVREPIRYACPDLESIASQELRELRNGDDDPQPLTLDSFISQRTTPRTFGTPITIAEHTWCHVQSVEYYVWVKGDNQDRIDIRNSNPQLMAHGTLGPTLNMNAVTAMLERGMRKIRDSLVSFSRQLSNDVDCSDLEDADIVLPIVWRLGAKNVLTAADLTAYQCYDQWHQEVFRGIKRSHDDESYEHESEPSSSDSQASASISSSELAGSSTRAGTKPNKHVKVST